MRTAHRSAICLLALILAVAVGTQPISAKKKKDKKGSDNKDPYADYVWPPPPDDPRIKLDAVISGAADVETRSGFRRALRSAAPTAVYDEMKKPFGVAFDNEGRILVTDWGNAALLRFDRENRRMDVFGTKGAVTLRAPMGLDVATDGTIFVTDVSLRKVVAYDAEGKLKAVYGREGDLTNPTGVVVSPDGHRVYVADSKVHQIVVFDRETAERLSAFGERGDGDGQFAWPTSLDFGPEGHLFVVDQVNARIQMLDADGNYVDEFGERGVGFGQFDRPKDIAVDETGFIYVTDNAFNNVQLFDIDFTLLTFIGQGGQGPGQFHGATGVAVRGDEFAVVDQHGARVQVFKLVAPRND